MFDDSKHGGGGSALNTHLLVMSLDRELYIKVTFTPNRCIARFLSDVCRGDVNTTTR